MSSPPHRMNSQIPNDMNGSGSRQDKVNEFPHNNVLYGEVSRTFANSFVEKMRKALSLFKESCEGPILAQVWSPFKLGDQLVLTTHDQPCLLTTHFCGYRKVSMNFIFSNISGMGLPTRVFVTRLPEWTSHIRFYKKEEYLRAAHAVDHHVRGSIAVPIFEGSDNSCRAVLEIVTQAPKQNFDTEMESLCRALKAVNLWTIIPGPVILWDLFISQDLHLSGARKIVFAEMTNVLRGACCAHKLPLALTWIPCRSSIKSTTADILCLVNTACYVNDEKLHGFVQECSHYYLMEGQGAAGTTLKTKWPFLCEDVKRFNITCYPVVHHARKFGLTAAATFRLRSSYTGNNDYVVELFLPVDMKERSEQYILSRNLAVTMQTLFKSLRAVTEAELVGKEVDSQRESNAPRQQELCGGHGPDEKMKHTAAKNLPLSDRQQHFSGTLKNSGKSTGVCPTTFKRICGQHCLSRWQSRKISKASGSLKKLQSVLESVEGVESGLKIYPTNIEKRSQGESDSKIIIKATYRDYTIRFAFEPKTGCSHLYKEVGTRFKLQMAMFKLQYLDDEDDWIMLDNDSDLQECLNIFDAPSLRIRVCYLRT